MENKPVAKLIGANGNIFNLLSIASRALKEVGMDAEAKEMQYKVYDTESYDNALQVIMQYVEVQ